MKIFYDKEKQGKSDLKVVIWDGNTSDVKDILYYTDVEKVVYYNKHEIQKQGMDGVNQYVQIQMENGRTSTFDNEQVAIFYR